MAEPLRLTDCTALAKVLVRGGDGLGVSYGRARRDGSLLVGLLPDGWLVIAPPGSATDVVDRVEAGQDGGFRTVVDVTHAYTLLRLTGAATPAVLAKLCAIDLARAPDCTTVRTLVAGINATVIRDDQGGSCSFLLLCDRSYGEYVSDVLLDAGAEYDIGPP
ncbi:MAG: sarcosine oxidase subunit gamma [Nocardioidaceae bacterium]